MGKKSRQRSTGKTEEQRVKKPKGNIDHSSAYKTLKNNNKMAKFYHMLMKAGAIKSVGHAAESEAQLVDRVLHE